MLLLPAAPLFAVRCLQKRELLAVYILLSPRESIPAKGLIWSCFINLQILIYFLVSISCTLS